VNYPQLNKSDYRPLIPVVTFIVCTSIASSMFATLPWLAATLVIVAGGFAAGAMWGLSRDVLGRWRLIYRLCSVVYLMVGLAPITLLTIQKLIAD
jgi:hypothetical protein